MAEGKLVSATIGFTYLKKLEDAEKRFKVLNITIVRMARIYILELSKEEQDKIVGETIRVARVDELRCQKLRLQDQVKHLDQDIFDLE